MSEKILARASGKPRVEAGDTVLAEVDLMMTYETFTLCAVKLAELGIEKMARPERMAVVLDHFYPANTEAMALGQAMARELARKLEVGHFLGHAGVCHQVLMERGLVKPGMLVLGTDSHTTTYGALGAAGTGIGVTEMVYVMATGELWFRVPPTVRFDLGGKVGSPCVMSKDVMLHLAGRFGTESAQYRAIEYAGPYAESLSVAGRMTMANMGVELGAKFAFFAADETALEFLEDLSAAGAAPLGPDPDAEYESVHDIDVSGIEPQVACPHSPGNVKPVTGLGRVEVQQAYLGSCTNARLEDLKIAASILKGRKVSADTRLLVSPASRRVYLEALEAGYLETLARAGASITAPGCGACYGAHGGVLAPGETCISSTNRNFRGRMGSDGALVYLGSPATVAASAIAGRIADPREYWQTAGAGRRQGIDA